MTVKQLRLPDGTQVAYTLERKNVKNINLRVRTDGTVAVSAPRRVPEAEVERVVDAKARFIDGALERLRQARLCAGQTERTLTDGEGYTIAGQAFVLRVAEGTVNELRAVDGELRMTVKNADVAVRQQLLNRFYVEESRRWMTPVCKQVWARFCAAVPAFPTRFPELRFRRMRTRWGSCQPGKGVITFNTLLLEHPEACMEYVAVHEFAHLLHPDHSKAFYQTVELLLPDWRARKALLAGHAMAADD